MTSPYGTLYHSNTGDPIGPATSDHLAASLRSDAAGQNGHFLIDADGVVIADGSWSGHHTGVRSVYVAGEPDSPPEFVPEPSWEADYVHGQCDVDDCEADATAIVNAIALIAERIVPVEASVCAAHAAEGLIMFTVSS